MNLPLSRALMAASSKHLFAVKCFSTSTAAASKYFMLSYTYVPDVVNKRAPFRPQHLKHAQQYVSEGKLLLGGAFADPVDSAAVVFKTDGIEDVEKFARADPYVQGGIVTDWKIREWTVVVGTTFNQN